MYVVYTFEEWVGVAPDVYHTAEDINEAVLEVLRREIENKGDPEYGLFIAVVDAEVLGDGVFLPDDPKVYLPTRYRVLAFKPVNLEVVRGEVVSAREIGLFVNIGPVDGLVYKTQIMDERVEFLPSRDGFRGVDSGRTIVVGDVVRARVVQIAKESRRGEGRVFRIGLTMRQPYLGKEEWVRQQAAGEEGG